MIICLSSLKGGSGKTTLAVHLAHAIALSKKKVILIDADPQGSSIGWAASREDKPPFPVLFIGNKLKELEKSQAKKQIVSNS